MAGRSPGTLGTGNRSPHYLAPGPLGVNSGPTHRARAPLGMDAFSVPPRASLFSNQEHADAEAELTLLSVIIGTIKTCDATVIYVKPVVGKSPPFMFDTEAYLTDRNAFCGSTPVYSQYVANV